MGFVYFEISVKIGENVVLVFENVVKIGYISKKKLGGRKWMKLEFVDLYLKFFIFISKWKYVFWYIYCLDF